MNVLSGIRNFFGNLFGGDDEEKKKRQQSSQSMQRYQPQQQSNWQAPMQAPGMSNQPNNRTILDQPLQKPNNGVSLYLPGKDGNNLLDAPLKKAPQDPVGVEIQKLKDKERPKAVEEEKKATSWFSRTFTDRNWDKRADVTATNRAVRAYQDAHGYDPQPAIGRNLRKSRELSNDLVQEAANKNEQINRASDKLDRAGQKAQWVPVTGSVLNLGLAGAERLQKATGRHGDAKATADTRNRVDFGMTTNEINQLDEKTRGKLQTIRNLGLIASPLDFLGFGGLVKSGGAKVAKDAAMKLVKRQAIDEATKTALKKGTVETAKNLAIPTAAGTGISLAGQQYLTGDMDPVEAAKTGLMVGGTSLLFPGRNLKKAAAESASEVAPGVSSVNPNREADAMAQQTAQAAKEAELAQAQAEAANLDTPAYQRRPVKAAAEQMQQSATDQRAQELGVGPDHLDVPAYQRQGRPLAPPEYNPDEFRTGFAQGARDTVADANPNLVSQAWRDTGSQDPLTILINGMAGTTHKAQVRQIVQRLVPEAEGNTLNRAVNEIVGADTPQEVAQALWDARHISRNADEARKMADALEQVAPAPTPVAQAAENAPAPTGTPAPVQTPAESPVATPQSEQRQVYSEAAQSDIPVVKQAAGELTAKLDQQEAPVMPQMPAANAQTAPAAPLSHDALVRQLGPAGSDMKGKYSERDVINLDDLRQRADGVIANMDDEQVLQAFQTTGPETMVTDANSFALARSALERLGKMDKDPVAVQTVTNIMDAMDRYVSKSGQGLRIAQEAFDNLPLPMKVRYIVKKIDSANAETKGYQPLRDDPAKAEVVEATITGYLKGSQAISERVSQIEGQLNDVADAARNGEKTTSNVKSLVNTLRTEKRNLAANNGELVKYYTDLMPKRSKGQRALNDFPRRMMLVSFTGRVNDLLTTAGNVSNLGVQNFTQGLLAKAVNLVKPGTVTDTWKGAKAFLQGTKEGVRQGAAEFGGTQYAGDLEKALRGNADARTGLQKSKGPIGRVVQAATEFATKASQGVQDQRLYQLADQEAAQLGLKGAMRRQYAEARAAVPSRHMQEQAVQLHKEVNNLNENPVTHTLNRVAASIEGKSAMGGFIKNQVMPFTSWLGGNIFNTVTDKNVVASFIKVANSARKGDAEGIVRNLSKFANNAAYTYALGYLLTQAGIVTNQDANGYNDAGAYIHFNDRYIPVGFTGFFAPHIILGNAAYNGLNNPEGGSPAATIAKAAGNGLMNLAKSVSLTSALGAENNISRAFDAANRPGGDFMDGAATFAGGAVGQFMPAAGNDVNAVLNNGLSIGGQTIIPDALNPTHEAANTKVEDPNSKSGHAKDVPKSAVASLVNRVPFASQLTLPRKADVAANDLLDRVSKGSRDTTGAKVARADEKAKGDQAADFKARDVPNFREKNFDDAVKARIEAGDYDKAIEGLQAKLDNQRNDKNVPESKNKAIEKHITELTVTRDGGFEPDMIELYKKTSLTEWRNMGDPKSEDYDPDMYALLYRYDSALAAAGVSRNTTKGEKNFYFAKADKSSSGYSRGGRTYSSYAAYRAEADALKRIQSNKIGSTPDLGKISFGDLAPQKAGSVKMPTIQQIKAGDLIKKRKIAVSKA